MSAVREPTSIAATAYPAQQVWSTVLVWGAGLFVLAGTLSFVMARTWWLADLVNFFRPHLFVAGGFWSVLCVLRRSRSTILAALATLLAATVPLLAVPPAAGPAEGFPLRVMAANLLIDNPETERLADYTAQMQPDVILSEETSPHWQEALVDFAELPFESGRDLKLHNDMKLLSRYPIVSEKVVEDQERFPSLIRHPIRFEIALPDRHLVLYATHPDTPRRPWQWEQRNLYLALLAEAVNGERAGTAVIVAGDWNTPSWSPFLRDFFEKTGLRSTESRWWPAPTRFSTRFGSIVALGMPIDHIAVSPGIGLSAFRTGPKFGSNHVPIVADVTIPAG